MDILKTKHHHIPFELKRSKRSKRLQLKIDPQGPKLVLTVPFLTFGFQINAFLNQQFDWIDHQWTKCLDQQANAPKLKFSQAYYRQKARRVIRERLYHFSQLYGLSYNKLAIRDQKTRWGSCSSKKNLNFSWRLILAPPEVLDYVVVHELCHLKHMDHSKAFWQLVSRHAPDYLKHKRWLKENHYLLSAS